jgi:hypothetical protein
MFNDINIVENINWEYSGFEVETFYNEENPIISKYYLKLESQWSDSKITPSLKGIEIKGLIFRTKESFCVDG